jgi:hypothetical protein
MLRTVSSVVSTRCAEGSACPRVDQRGQRSSGRGHRHLDEPGLARSCVATRSAWAGLGRALCARLQRVEPHAQEFRDTPDPVLARKGDGSGPEFLGHSRPSGACVAPGEDLIAKLAQRTRIELRVRRVRGGCSRGCLHGPEATGPSGRDSCRLAESTPSVNRARKVSRCALRTRFTTPREGSRRTTARTP